MKDKKIIFLIIFAILLIIAVVTINKTKKNNVQTNNAISDIKYNEETGEYYIKNEITNEIIASGEDEASLQIYIDNPDYNPNPFGTSDMDTEGIE